ncbi:bleomycin resistance family protein [Brevibacillus formosus]|uniref:Bleomycin resistance protein n=1 Tax=Brevibacillus formosus TaxID=54913 RepID=A0A220MID2_9BACL|nr:glyoxalase superfamily protein [Brevibacillus formosus]ASJ54753.1 bleomycin resistance family protein [Brevibacillus formosus]
MNQIITPIFRMFDVEKAREFYVEFLGFQIDWEHRYEDHFPLYMQISSPSCTLHLSEHHGDACPGSAIRVQVENIELFHQSLLGQGYKYAHPGLEETPWGTREVSVTDPFGNRLHFYQPVDHS